MIPKKFIEILDQFVVRVGIKEGLTLDLFWTPNNFEKKNTDRYSFTGEIILKERNKIRSKLLLYFFH